MSTWFEDLTGVSERSSDQVRRELAVDGEWLTSSANGGRWRCGVLELPSLGEPRAEVAEGELEGASVAVREVVADVQDLHRDPANAGAMFQVASQFNLLEMAGPEVTPERGVGIYQHDHTQGPACAIACGAGTIFRNYFVDIDGQQGQTAERQIDCLRDLGLRLGNEGGQLWRMRNGYALPSQAGLQRVAESVSGMTPDELDACRDLLRIGVQRDAQVTLGGCEHVVTQAFCSAMPVTYSGLPASLWDPLARLVLEAAYEATMCTAIVNARRTGCRRLYLTLLGGGAFGNPVQWIVTALRRAVEKYRRSGLEVAIVSHGRSRSEVAELVRGV